MLQQAAQVAVEGHHILQLAAKHQQLLKQDIAEVWTDGSLGSIDGLPDRKTRTYIPDSMAHRQSRQSAPASQQHTAASSEEVDHGSQPAKKKRKGKSERNRLKREAAEQATLGHAHVSV